MSIFTLQILRGLLSDLPTLAEGQMYYATDTKAFYIGGVSGNDGPIGGSVPPGVNVTRLPGSPGVFPGFTAGAVNTSGATNSICQAIPANAILCNPQKWTVSIDTYSASCAVTMQIVSCTPGTGTVIARANITFGGSSSPTLAPAGVYTSDVINFPISPAYDYYVILNVSTDLINIISNGNGLGDLYVQASNFIGATTMTFAGGNPEYGKSVLTSFMSA